MTNYSEYISNDVIKFAMTLGDKKEKDIKVNFNEL